MRIGNIERVPVFAQQRGRTLTLAETALRYAIVPDGRLTYVGLVAAAAERFRSTGLALSDAHRAVAEDVLTSRAGGDWVERELQFALEPAERSDPYGFVASNAALVSALAAELQAYVLRAGATGKRLSLVIRYGSEMNDAGATPYSGDPKAFVASYRAVREIFAARAPDVRFTFAPAIRADLRPRDIVPYWPGDDAVDVCGATWYVHGLAQEARAIAHFHTYFREASTRGKSLGIDEFGGAEGSGSGGPSSAYEHNDRMLARMLAAANALDGERIAFAYGILFLDEKKYGVDATLRFLSRVRSEETAG